MAPFDGTAEDVDMDEEADLPSRLYVDLADLDGGRSSAVSQSDMLVDTIKIKRWQTQQLFHTQNTKKDSRRRRGDTPSTATKSRLQQDRFPCPR